MAREQLNPNQSSQKIEAMHAVQVWFGLETKYQLSAGFKDHSGNPTHTRDNMLTTKIRAEWDQFRRARFGKEAFPSEATRKLQIGRNALKACVAAQAAYAWDEVAGGTDRDTALYATLVLLDGHVAEVEAGRRLLPDYDLLSKPVNVAVNQCDGSPNSFRKPVRAFISLAYLATTAIIEQTSEQYGPILPQPAVTDDVLIPWSHK